MDIIGRDSTILIQKYLAVIDSASLEIAKDEQVQIISALVERLKGMVEVLGKVCDPSKEMDPACTTSQVSFLFPWYVSSSSSWQQR